MRDLESRVHRQPLHEVGSRAIEDEVSQMGSLFCCCVTQHFVVTPERGEGWRWCDDQEHELDAGGDGNASGTTTGAATLLGLCRHLGGGVNKGHVGSDIVFWNHVRSVD